MGVFVTCSSNRCQSRPPWPSVTSIRTVQLRTNPFVGVPVTEREPGSRIARAHLSRMTRSSGHHPGRCVIDNKITLVLYGPIHIVRPYHRRPVDDRHVRPGNEVDLVTDIIARSVRVQGGMIGPGCVPHQLEVQFRSGPVCAVTLTRVAIHLYSIEMYLAI